MCSDHPKQWCFWLPLAEFWYNTNFYSAIRSTPYEVVYGQTPPLHIPYVPGSSTVDSVDRSLTAREAALHLSKHNLQKAQNRMKQQADQHRSERVFEQGDWVYVKLQPYRQHSLRSTSCQKLSPRYFGLFQIITKVGSVAYTRQLPTDARIHPTFHVSLLKRHVGNQPVQQHIPTRLTD